MVAGILYDWLDDQATELASIATGAALRRLPDRLQDGCRSWCQLTTVFECTPRSDMFDRSNKFVRLSGRLAA